MTRVLLPEGFCIGMVNVDYAALGFVDQRAAERPNLYTNAVSDVESGQYFFSSVHRDMLAGQVILSETPVIIKHFYLQA
jgi:hypothetical protein